MAVSVTLRNTFLEVADAPPKRRLRASSSPLMEDSCEETIVPSDDSAESCDEKVEAQHKGTRLAPQNVSVIGRSPAFAAKSPALCPWPSTPEFLPLYKTDVEEVGLSLPPCAEELLPISLLDSPCMGEAEAGHWEQSWPQMYWPEDPSYGYYNAVAQPLSEPAMPFFGGRAEAEGWTQPGWAEQPWTESPPDVKPPPLPRRRVSAENNRASMETRTTVMLKNMPNNQTRQMLRELLDREGFATRYDFVYLPYDFKTGATLGYAFVNFGTSAAALEAFVRFEGYSKWSVPSRKVCSVGWSEPHQGLEPHIERYRDSPVMHHDVPEKFKPLILKNGAPVPFPPPTKKLRAPRLRGLVE